MTWVKDMFGSHDRQTQFAVRKQQTRPDNTVSAFGEDAVAVTLTDSKDYLGNTYRLSAGVGSSTVKARQTPLVAVDTKQGPIQVSADMAHTPDRVSRDDMGHIMGSLVKGLTAGKNLSTLVVAVDATTKRSHWYETAACVDAARDAASQTGVPSNSEFKTFEFQAPLERGQGQSGSQQDRSVQGQVEMPTLQELLTQRPGSFYIKQANADTTAPGHLTAGPEQASKTLLCLTDGASFPTKLMQEARESGFHVIGIGVNAAAKLNHFSDYVNLAALASAPAFIREPVVAAMTAGVEHGAPYEDGSTSASQKNLRDQLRILDQNVGQQRGQQPPLHLMHPQHLAAVSQSIASGVPTLLVGRLATVKGDVIRHLNELTGNPLVEIDLSQGQDRHVVGASLRENLDKGAWVVLKNLNQASAGVLDAIMPHAQKRSNGHLFATMEPSGYAGRRELPPQIAERFSRVDLNDPSPEEMLGALCKRYPAVKPAHFMRLVMVHRTLGELIDNREIGRKNAAQRVTPQQLGEWAHVVAKAPESNRGAVAYSEFTRIYQALLPAGADQKTASDVAKLSLGPANNW